MNDTITAGKKSSNGKSFKASYCKNQNDSPIEKPVYDNVAVIIVTYWPDVGFAERVEYLSTLFTRILVVDNSGGPNQEVNLLLLTKKYNIEILINTCNLGIATAMNKGINWSINKGYKWTLTLDQDTLIKDNILDEVGVVYDTIQSKKFIGLIGCNYKDLHGSVPTHWSVSQENNTYIDALVFISSGSFLNNKAFLDCGPFREDYFIDYVDNEYSLRAISKGYHIYITKKYLMTHSVGNRTSHKFIWRNFYTNNHVAFRRYFIARNRIWTLKKYWKYNTFWCSHQILVAIIEVLKIILFESGKTLKLIALLDGYLDAFSKTKQDPQEIIRKYLKI